MNVSSEAAVRRGSSKEVFLNICNIHRKTAVLESLLACNFIKKRLQHRCFLVNIAKFLKTAFYRTPPVAASGFIIEI